MPGMNPSAQFSPISPQTRIQSVDAVRGFALFGVLLAQRPEWQAILKPLRNLGRMALTVYLSSTLMFTTQFYGWGFSQLFLLGPATTTFYAALFFIIQMIFCTWWLARFRFGPAEWLWRSLTYMKLQSMR
jgi:uncharacterized protein